MKMITEALAKALNELGSCHGDGAIWDSHSHENPTPENTLEDRHSPMERTNDW